MFCAKLIMTYKDLTICDLHVHVTVCKKCYSSCYCPFSLSLYLIKCQEKQDEHVPYYKFQFDENTVKEISIIHDPIFPGHANAGRF